jgi:uncharacterized protein (DUF58 family)
MNLNPRFFLALSFLFIAFLAELIAYQTTGFSGMVILTITLALTFNARKLIKELRKFPNLFSNEFSEKRKFALRVKR